MTHTYTYVIMALSEAAFMEIKRKLEEAGYHHAIDEDGEHTLLDMHGIALFNEDEK